MNEAYDELLKYQLAFCVQKLYTETSTYSDSFLEFLSFHLENIAPRKVIMDINELDSINIADVAYCELPYSWIDLSSMNTEIARITSLPFSSNAYKSFIQLTLKKYGVVFFTKDIPQWMYTLWYNIPIHQLLTIIGQRQTEDKKWNISIHKALRNCVIDYLSADYRIHEIICSTGIASLSTGYKSTLDLTLYTDSITWENLQFTILSNEYELFLDTETTGLPIKMHNILPSDYSQFPFTDFEDCRLLEIGWVIRHKFTGIVVDRATFLIKPPSCFKKQPYDLSLYHDAIENGYSFNEIIEELFKRISSFSSTLICHNVCFDRAVIAHELAVNSMDLLYKNWISLSTLCTMNEATIPYGRRPRLQNLYNFFELPPFNQTHRALDDVNMLIACYDEMKKRKWI